MNDQEMQFADPEWQPPSSRSGSTSTAQPNAYAPTAPTPINTMSHEPLQGRFAVEDEGLVEESIPSQLPQYADGYAGPSSYVPPRPQQSGLNVLGQRQYRRRSRSPWLWLILILIIVGLFSGGQWMIFPRSVPSGDTDFGGKPQPVFSAPQTFSVGLHSTIVVNGGADTITVIASSDLNNNVEVQTTDPNGNGAQNYTATTSKGKDASMLTITADTTSGSSDLQIAVPVGATLQVDTTSDINVSGVSGQMHLTTTSGSINATQDHLSRNSLLQTQDGPITFDGSLDPNGIYQFHSGSGTVDVILPSNTAFHVDALTQSGSFNSDFTINGQSGTSGASVVHADVGSSSNPQVDIRTDSGDINLDQKN